MGAVRRYGGNVRRAALTAAAAIGRGLRSRTRARGRSYTGTKAPARKRQRQKYRRPGSGSKTEECKERIIRPPGYGGMSHSYAYHGKRGRVRALKNMTEPAVIHETDSAIIDSGNTGQQAYGYNLSGIPVEFCGVHLTALQGQALTYSSPPTGSASTQRSFKIVISQCITTTRLTNFHTTSASVDIYDIVTKNMVLQSNNDPIASWGAGLVTTRGTNSAPSIDPRGWLGSVPTTSFIFNKYYKIIKRTKTELGPGQSHEHVFVHKPNRVYDMEKSYLDQANTGADIKGLTHYTLIIANGIAVETAAGSGACTTSSVKIGCVTNRRSSIRLLTTSPRITTFNNAISRTSAGTEQYINFGDGLVKTGEQEA